MSDSDDDVVIIDSSSSSSNAVSPSRGGDGHHRHDAPTPTAPLATRAAAVATRPPPSSSSLPTPGTLDATRRALEKKIDALPPLRAEADTQTDRSADETAASATAADGAATLHRHLLEMEAALGIPVHTAAGETPPSTVQTAVRRLVESWRDTSCRWKRSRQHDDDADAAGTEGAKHVKREGGGGEAEDARPRPPAAASLHRRAAPAWAAGLETVLERRRELATSPLPPLVARHAPPPPPQGRKHPCATAPSPLLPVPTSAHSVRDLGSTVPARGEPAPEPGAAPAPHPTVLDVNAALLREAELICARERTETLLPLYAELHALRRLRADTVQQAAQAEEGRLEWEQRRLADMLAECDAQLAALDGNFTDACRAQLAPLEMLQQRMDALAGFRRQLEAHTAAMTPLSAADGAGARARALAATADSGARTQRSMGLVGAALSQHMVEERHAWEAKVAALQARLDEQGRRNEELQSCYAQANAQLQGSLDSGHYVPKDVLAAATAQHRVERAAVVEQLGWTLLHSTSDVLSLRHPVSGATLHVNHAYSTINGQSCGDVATALAAYMLKHSSPAAKAVSPAAVVPAPPPPPPALSEEQSTAEAAPAPTDSNTDAADEEVAPQRASGATEAADAPVGDGGVLDARSSAPSARESATPPATPSSGQSAAHDDDVRPSQTRSPSAASQEGTREGAEATPGRLSSAASHEHGDGSGGVRSGSDGSDGGDGNASVDNDEDCAAEEVVEDEDEDEEEQQEDVVGYSNVPTEESAHDSGAVDSSAATAALSSSSAPIAGPSTGDGAGAARPGSAPYESFFSASELWESEDV